MAFVTCSGNGIPVWDLERPQSGRRLTSCLPEGEGLSVQTARDSGLEGPPELISTPFERLSVYLGGFIVGCFLTACLGLPFGGKKQNS